MHVKHRRTTILEMQNEEIIYCLKSLWNFDSRTINNLSVLDFNFKPQEISRE